VERSLCSVRILWRGHWKGFDFYSSTIVKNDWEFTSPNLELCFTLRVRETKNRFHGMQPDGATRTLPRAISWTTTKTYFCLNPQLSRINLYVGIRACVNVERVPNNAGIQERGCTRREMNNRVHIFILILVKF